MSIMITNQNVFEMRPREVSAGQEVNGPATVALKVPARRSPKNLRLVRLGTAAADLTPWKLPLVTSSNDPTT